MESARGEAWIEREEVRARDKQKKHQYVFGQFCGRGLLRHFLVFDGCVCSLVASTIESPRSARAAPKMAHLIFWFDVAGIFFSRALCVRLDIFVDISARPSALYVGESAI